MKKIRSIRCCRTPAAGKFSLRSIFGFQPPKTIRPNRIAQTFSPFGVALVAEPLGEIEELLLFSLFRYLRPFSINPTSIRVRLSRLDR